MEDDKDAGEGKKRNMRYICLCSTFTGHVSISIKLQSVLH